MTLIDIHKDYANLGLVVTCEFAASPERVWRLWDDPRQLERWWGPPGYPATFTRHELAAGGRTSYHMTGPEGEQHHGWWRIVVAEPPTRIELVDGFAGPDGQPIPGMPESTMVVELEAAGDITRMVMKARYESREQLDQVLEMGMIEGLSAALGQIEAVLADAAA